MGITFVEPFRLWLYRFLAKLLLIPFIRINPTLINKNSPLIKMKNDYICAFV